MKRTTYIFIGLLVSGLIVIVATIIFISDVYKRQGKYVITDIAEADEFLMKNYDAKGELSQNLACLLYTSLERYTDNVEVGSSAFAVPHS